MAISSHESASAMTVEWLTPPEVLKALGPFDLDPCSPRIRPWDTAARHVSLPDNGLAMQWTGRVWLNPPYGKWTGRWLQKLAAHGNGIAMIFARTETQMFFEYIWHQANGILFLKGRPCFHRPDGTKASGNSGAPVCLVAYGSENADQLQACGIPGYYVKLR